MPVNCYDTVGSKFEYVSRYIRLAMYLYDGPVFPIF